MNNPTKHFMVVMEYLNSKRGGIKDNSLLRKIKLRVFLAHTLDDDNWEETLRR